MKVTPVILSYIFVLATVLCGFNLHARDFVVVIDPGHGGKDYGAIGKITNEKTINLDVALLVGEKLEKKFPHGLKLVYTRNDDRFISLKERANIANKAQGDIFISIHVNSVDKRNRNRSTIKGASVYTLGLHKSADNLEVAKRENAVMTLEEDYTESYEGFDPESTESYIIFELSQNSHMGQSVKLASEIQSELVSTAGRSDRGVRQAGYWVLWATGMPSVLVELDFICNPEQEKFLNSKNGKEKMAQSIFNAICNYISSIHNDKLEINANTDSETTKDAPVKFPAGATIYKVQFLTSSRKLKNGAPEFKGLGNVSSYKDGALMKYTVGKTTDQNEANKILSETVKKFPAAFIVEFKDGKRIK